MGYRRSRNRTQAQDFAQEYGDPHSDHREIENVKNHGGTGNHHQHKHANRFNKADEDIWLYYIPEPKNNLYLIGN